MSVWGPVLVAHALLTRLRQSESNGTRSQAVWVEQNVRFFLGYDSPIGRVEAGFRSRVVSFEVITAQSGKGGTSFGAGAGLAVLTR
jgi:hypothetical protein